MTPQEREVLSRFLQQLEATRDIPKDPEAEAMIRSAGARQPDALYLTVQRALLNQLGLEAAQARVTELEKQLEEARSSAAPGSRSFLGDSTSWGRSAATSPVPGVTPAGIGGSAIGGSTSGGYNAPGAYGSQGAGMQPRAQSAMPSFLGTAAATAAGVVGGAFLFQGIERMLHHNAPWQQGNQSAFSGSQASALTSDDRSSDRQYASASDDRSYASSRDDRDYAPSRDDQQIGSKEDNLSALEDPDVGGFTDSGFSDDSFV